MKKVFADEAKLGLIISTVDGFQGGEKDYLIVSMVKSNKDREDEVITDINRVTVLLSRARTGLLIVGNHKTLLKGQIYNPWVPVIDYLSRNDSVKQFTPELTQKAKDNYKSENPKKRDTSKEAIYDLWFDALDQEQLDRNQRYYQLATYEYEQND